MYAQGLLGAVCAAIVAGSSVLSAQSRAGRPDFTGTWRMDTTKFEKHDRALAGLTLTVSNHGDTLVVVTDVLDVGRPPTQMRANYLSNAVKASQAAHSTLPSSVQGWIGDTLVLRSVEQRPERTLNIEERWTLDASGETLSRSQIVVDGIRWSRQTLVFTRL